MEKFFSIILKPLIELVGKLADKIMLALYIGSRAKNKAMLKQQQSEEKARENVRKIHNRVINDAGLRKLLKDKIVK